MSRYDDIISLPYQKSKKHPPMSNMDRAAQFSPFAALKGYEEEIGDESLAVDERITLDDGSVEEIDSALRTLRETPMEAAVTFFQPHEKKEGGIYVRERGLCRVDPMRRLLLLNDRQISFEDILSVEIDFS